MKSIRRPLFFTLFVPLLVFYCYVTLIAFNPNVSAIYRLYYIDKKLLHWNKGRGLNYTLGTMIDFTKEVPYQSRHGWSGAEHGGTWSNGKVSELYFDLKDSNIPKKIEIVGHPFLAPSNGVNVQGIKVFANNEPIGETVLDSPEKVTLDFLIPNTVKFNINDLFVIRIQYSNPISPESIGTSPDSRELAFYVEKIIIY
ncbi:MAG: hypothetical protein ACU88J_02205 [Gammaproteobacteria bacterium]